MPRKTTPIHQQFADAAGGRESLPTKAKIQKLADAAGDIEEVAGNLQAAAAEFVSFNEQAYDGTADKEERDDAKEGLSTAAEEIAGCFDQLAEYMAPQDDTWEALAEVAEESRAAAARPGPSQTDVINDPPVTLTIENWNYLASRAHAAVTYRTAGDSEAEHHELSWLLDGILQMESLRANTAPPTAEVITIGGDGVPAHLTPQGEQLSLFPDETPTAASPSTEADK